MGKVGIITDSGAGLQYMHFKHNIKVAKLPINFGETVLIDGKDTDAYSFYQLIENSDIIPSTSGAFPGEIVNAIKECVSEGCTDVIYIPLSLGLSGYGNNLLVTSDVYAKYANFHVFKCHTTCVMQAYIAKYAEILAEKGYQAEEILKELEKMQNNTFAYFVVDNLKYLVKNGRLNAALGFIGGIMKIKPIIFLGDETGKLKIHEKVRTLNKALDREFHLLSEGVADAKEVVFLAQDSGRPEMGQKLVERLKQDYSEKMVSVGYSPISPVIGAHSGPGLLGVGAIILDDLLEKEELKKI